MNTKLILIYSLTTVMSVFGCVAFAANNTPTLQTLQTLQTEYLQPVIGARESTLGAQIQAIDKTPSAVRIEISLPQHVDTTHSELIVEEMIIIGESHNYNLPAGTTEAVPEITQVQKFEWINHIDRGEYGLVVYLPKSESFALKINYRNLSQEQRTGFAPHR